jgi:Zn finger protein HypA/HybF involved in hydrogenase expression
MSKKKEHKRMTYCKHCGRKFRDENGTGVCPDCRTTVAVISMAFAKQAGLRWDARKGEWVE